MSILCCESTESPTTVTGCYSGTSTLTDNSDVLHDIIMTQNTKSVVDWDQCVQSAIVTFTSAALSRRAAPTNFVANYSLSLSVLLTFIFVHIILFHLIFV